MIAAFPHVARDGAVAVVTLDRPPVNALRFADYVTLAAALRGLGDDPALGCIVLTGAGSRAFIGGHDLAELAALTAETAAERLPLARDLHAALVTSKIPLVAALNGAAIGNGLAIAALCDTRIASSAARFALPEIKRGVIGGAAAISRLVPDGHLRRLVLTGETIDAAQALAIGLVDEVCAPEQVLARATALAAAIAGNDRDALQLLRPALPRLRDLPYLDAYALECELTARLRQTARG